MIGVTRPLELYRHVAPSLTLTSPIGNLLKESVRGCDRTAAFLGAQTEAGPGGGTCSNVVHRAHDRLADTAAQRDGPELLGLAGPFANGVLDGKEGLLLYEH